MQPPLIVDSHLDLAWNMLAFGRDYTRPAAETRRLETETGSPAIQNQGHTLLGWQEFQQGRVAVIFSTLFVTPAKKRKDWETIFYTDPREAHRLYLQQLDLYRELTDRHEGKFHLIGANSDLGEILAGWADDEVDSHPVGLLPLMEGAEGIQSPSELERWWQGGLRIIAPAWAGNHYCGGTGEPGPLTEEGRQLLKAMAGFGFLLDVSHMDELAARQALDLYPGAVIASHANASALIPGYHGNRHLSDSFIRALIGRGGIIGLIPSCRLMDYNWRKRDPRERVTLDMLAAQVDHICQLGGSAENVGFGSDFDGGFGVESVPAELDTIADLHKLAPLLLAKGYNDEQVTAFFGGNWIQFLQAYLPA